MRVVLELDKSLEEMHSDLEKKGEEAENCKDWETCDEISAKLSLLRKLISCQVK